MQHMMSRAYERVFLGESRILAYLLAARVNDRQCWPSKVSHKGRGRATLMYSVFSVCLEMKGACLDEDWGLV